MRKAVNTIVQYEILNPHHCGAGQEECKELASSKSVQKTTDSSQKLRKFLVGEGSLFTFWMSSVGAAACEESWDQCSSSDSSQDLSELSQRHSCLGNCPMSEGSRLFLSSGFLFHLQGKHSLSGFLTQASMKQVTKTYCECRCHKASNCKNHVIGL